MNSSRRQRRRLFAAAICFTLAYATSISPTGAGPFGPMLLTGCVTTPPPLFSADTAVAQGSALGLRLHSGEESVELVVGDQLALGWMLPNPSGQWILHRGSGRLAHVDPGGQFVKLATNSGSHQIPMSGIVGVSPGGSLSRNVRRTRAGWIGGALVVAGIAGSLATSDDFGGFVALLTSPVTVPTGAALGTLASAAFFEGRPVEPIYLIDREHFQIEVVQP